MTSRGEIFLIFRKWKEESSWVELVGGALEDAPTLRPARTRCKVVDVSEPDEITLLPEGESGEPFSIDLLGAELRYGDPRETRGPTSMTWICFVELVLASGEICVLGERKTS